MSKQRDKIPQQQGGQGLNKQLDPEFFERFMQNQAEELAVRREENEIKRKELDYSYEHARRVLDAQLQDRESDRKHVDKTNARGFRLGIMPLTNPHIRISQTNERRG